MEREKEKVEGRREGTNDSIRLKGFSSSSYIIPVHFQKYCEKREAGHRIS